VTSFRQRARHHAGAAAALLVLTVAMTWPIGRLWRPELPNLPDASFNVWRIAWTAHQLRADPAHLFDANIFYPAPLTLAYSDAMLFVGALASPLIWLGLHPFVVQNLLMLAAFWTAGLATYVVCLRFTGDARGAFAGALVGSFVPYRFGHIAHLELLWTAFIPLGFAALVSIYERPRVGNTVQLAAAAALQTLCSIYYGIYFAVYLALSALLLAFGRSRTDLLRIGAAILCAGALTTAALLPYALTYGRARTLLAGRTTAEIAQFSAVPADYLHVSQGHVLPLPRAEQVAEEVSLYPGALAVGLAIVALMRVPRQAALHAALLVLSVDLSFGMNGVLYPWLLRLAPMLNGLRAPARFGAFVTLSLSILAALGTVQVLNRSRAPRVVASALALLIVAEYWAGPVRTRAEPTTPAGLYSWLARQPRAPVAELPLPVPEGLWKYETDFQLMSIYHWQPLTNGYSGNIPETYVDFLKRMRRFPDADSLASLRARGVRWIIIHETLIADRDLAALMQQIVRVPGLRTVGTYPDRWGRATVLELVMTSS
jgi:hypothetical protein